MRIRYSKSLARGVRNRHESSLQVAFKLLPSCVLVTVLAAICTGAFPTRAAGTFDLDHSFYLQFALAMLNCVIISLLVGAGLLAVYSMLRLLRGAMRAAEIQQRG